MTWARMKVCFPELNQGMCGAALGLTRDGRGGMPCARATAHLDPATDGMDQSTTFCRGAFAECIEGASSSKEVIAVDTERM
jgi:hypothetical protein